MLHSVLQLLQLLQLAGGASALSKEWGPLGDVLQLLKLSIADDTRYCSDSLVHATVLQQLPVITSV
jgi:hypothetical protein